MNTYKLWRWLCGRGHSSSGRSLHGWKKLKGHDWSSDDVALHLRTHIPVWLWAWLGAGTAHPGHPAAVAASSAAPSAAGAGTGSTLAGVAESAVGPGGQNF